MELQTIDWILLGAIALALGVLIFLLIRRWRKLLLLDLSAMPKAKLRSKKYQLIEGRLQRRAASYVDVVGKMFAPVMRVLQEQGKRIYDGVVALERKYRNETLMDQSQQDKEKTRQKIAQMLERGITLFKEDKFADAEQIFLDIIRINPNEPEAFEHLGEIYIQRREFDNAIETLEYAKRLSPDDDAIAHDLGRVYQMRGELERAKRFFEEAVELHETNPRNIDALLRLAIDMKDGVTARKMLRQMKKVNPENQKIDEFAEKIRLMTSGLE